MKEIRPKFHFGGKSRKCSITRQIFIKKQNKTLIYQNAPQNCTQKVQFFYYFFTFEVQFVYFCSVKKPELWIQT